MLYMFRTHLKNDQVATDAAIALSKLATGALPTSITVASANLVNGTIVDADINASAAIALSKLATGALPAAITVAAANIGAGEVGTSEIAANAVTAAKLDASLLTVSATDVTVSTGELLALHSTPKEIVAAPTTATSFNVFLGALVMLDYNSAAYADVAEGDDLQFAYETSGVVCGTCETTGFIDQTADKWAWVQPAAGSFLVTANKAIQLKLAGAISTGDSPLKVRCYYRVCTAFA